MNIAYNIIIFLGAEGEALDATLPYFVRQILQMPDLQKELEAEVAGLTDLLTGTATAQLSV